MARVAVTISLSDDERAELEALSRRRKTSQGLARRARIVLYQGAVIKTHRDGLPWFSARRARRGDAAHHKAGGTTSEGLGKPPYGSRPLIAGGRQEA